jgi:hypothetical protein
VFVTAEYRREKQTVLAQVQNTARALMQIVDRELAARVAVGGTLATSHHLKQGNLEGFYEQARQVLSALPLGSNVSLADGTGQQVVNTLEPFGTPLPRRADMATLRRVFETRAPAFSNVFTGAVTRRPIIGVLVPVFRDGEVVYALALALPLDELNAILQRQQLPAGWRADILDGAQLFAARTAGSAGVGQKVPAPLAQAIMQQP